MIERSQVDRIDGSARWAANTIARGNGGTDRWANSTGMRLAWRQQRLRPS
jgi:hypothetical protein